MPTSSDFISVEKKLLESQEKNLIEQYKAVFLQQEFTLDEGNKLILKNKLLKLTEEINDVHHKLEKLENPPETRQNTPLYEFSTPDNFDLDELIRHCQTVLRRKQGLIGLAVHYTGHYFLSNFKKRLKIALHRENVFIAPSITLAASHTTIDTGVRLARRHLLKLSQYDVLIDIVSTDQSAAERFWQTLNSVFADQSHHRFIVIMAMVPESSFPQGLISLKPPCCDEGHIFDWVGKIVPHLSLLTSEPDIIMNEWTDAVINECSYQDQLDIDLVYEHLEAALNILKSNPTVPALYHFLEERKQLC